MTRLVDASVELKSTCVNFQELIEWSMFWLWTFAIKSLNDFGDLGVNLLKHMEEELKNQLGDYVSLEI